MAREHHFRLDGVRHTVTVDGDTVTFGPAGEDGATIEARYGDHVVASPNGRRAWAAVRARDGVWVCVDGVTVYLELAEADAADEDSTGGNEVRAPMTGTVVAVEAAPGDAVTAGQVLVVLTAMKMEYKLESPRDGVVASVDCAANESVELGQKLVILEPPDA